MQGAIQTFFLFYAMEIVVHPNELVLDMDDIHKSLVEEVEKLPQEEQDLKVLSLNEGDKLSLTVHDIALLGAGRVNDNSMAFFNDFLEQLEGQELKDDTVLVCSMHSGGSMYFTYKNLKDLVEDINLAGVENEG